MTSLHMDTVLTNKQKLKSINSVRTLNVVYRTYQEQWLIGTDGEREFRESFSFLIPNTWDLPVKRTSLNSLTHYINISLIKPAINSYLTMSSIHLTIIPIKLKEIKLKLQRNIFDKD